MVLTVASDAVLVNGLPGSGKSTVAGLLARELGVPLLSKDRVKEALVEVLDGATGPRLGAIAMETVWALAADAAGIVLVDSWWFAPRDREYVRRGLDRAGARGVEVWCDPPVELARARYAGRDRHWLHDDKRRLTEDWNEWAEYGSPLGLTPVVRVDTSRTVDIAALAKRVRFYLPDPID